MSEEAAGRTDIEYVWNRMRKRNRMRKGMEGSK